MDDCIPLILFILSNTFLALSAYWRFPSARQLP